MPKRNDRNIKVVGVRRPSPDLEKLAKAIVRLALDQLERERSAASSPAKPSERPRRPGAAA